MREALFSAPLERKTTINQSACIITLPLPDGSVQKFRVTESPVMADELSVSFPNIKTFSVKGIDDPYASGKLDWNEFGFHGMIFSINGDFFIDPYSTGTITDYISYYKSDFVKDPAHVTPEVGLLNEKQDNTGQRLEESLAKAANSAPAICVGGQLKTYRLAVACTGEYATTVTFSSTPTMAQILSKVVTSVNRVDGIYEKELSIRLILIPTTTLVLFANASTDPFTGTSNQNSSQLISLSQSVITATIGSANFDIGHTFSTGAGGLADLGCVCNNSKKAMGVTGSSAPYGDPYDVDYVAHEMGHQFDGNHTFNAVTDNCGGFNRYGPTAVEPGSGITIMGYAGICGTNNLANNSIAYMHAVSYDEIVNFVTTGAGAGCAVTLTTSNQAPVVTGSGNYVIPKFTPFVLTGSGTDPDGDVLTFSWEETDPGTTGGNWNSGSRPFFQSYAPVATAKRFFPKTSVVNGGNYTGTKGEYLPNSAQVLAFRLTARDNKMGGGGVCYAMNNITIDASGPLTVTNPNTVGIVWVHSTSQIITWDVNGTDQAPVSCDSVRILISYNNGNTYSVLVNSAANDGFKQVTAPTVSATISTCRIKIECINNIFYDIGNYNFTISNDPLVGLSSVSFNNPLQLVAWPNPSSNALHIAVGSLNSETSTVVDVCDLLGKSVKSFNYTGKAELKETLDISDVESGVYFIKVTNNNRYSTYKIVKE